jgi:hypothetical protein
MPRSTVAPYGRQVRTVAHVTTVCNPSDEEGHRAEPQGNFTVQWSRDAKVTAMLVVVTNTDKPRGTADERSASPAVRAEARTGDA